MPVLIGLLKETVDLLNAMSPYLLFGFFVAGLLKVFLKGDFIGRHLGSHDFMAILKASLFGIPLPLCSCGVMPAALALRKGGASKAAVLSFMVSTPTTGIDSILATFALLGGFFAGFRVLATFLVALLVGLVALLIKDVRLVKGTDQGGPAKCACCHNGAAAAAVSTAYGSSLGKKLQEALRYGFYDLLKDAGSSILLGIAIGGFISYFVPPSFVENYLGNVWLSMLVMLVIGIPMYVCSTGSIPIVAALMMKGLNPGAGFVFLITGPATNSVSFAVIAREFGLKSALLFLLSLVVGSLLMGALFNLAWQMWGVSYLDVMRHEHSGLIPVWVSYFSSLILLGGILFAKIIRRST